MSATAGTSLTFDPNTGKLALIRSGYGAVSVEENFIVMRGDADIDGVLAGQVAQLRITGNSPIALAVTDGQGDKVGFQAATAPASSLVDAQPQIVAEIFGASYFGVDTHPQVIKLPDPKPGSYQVKVTGTGTGSFSLTMETLTVNGGLIDRQTTSGNASPGSSASFNLNVTADGRLSMGGAPPADTVPPTTVASATPAANGAGWNNTNVRVMLSATDNPGGSGVQEITFSASGAQTIASTTVSGASATIDITTEGQTTITFFAKDHAGNIESAKRLIVKLDKTPPTIIPSRAPAPNGNGWNNTNVTVSFACSDSLSGLAAGSPPAPITLTGEGVNQSVDGTCQDIAGNSASARVSGINIDKTPPTVSCSASPNVLWPPNHNLVPVTLSVVVTDSLSGPAGFVLLSATSNEPDNGLGDGDLPNDIQGFAFGTPATSGQLRAERSGTGTGRVYTLTYKGMDRAGNSATCAATVMVPHDQRTP